MKTLTKDGLAHFTGSEEFTRYMGGIILSEGAMHVARAGEAFWLMDAIVSHQIDPKVSAQDFQVWCLTRTGDGGTLTCEDGDGTVVTKQEIEFTDFPLDNIILWFQNGTIFLPSEY